MIFSLVATPILAGILFVALVRRFDLMLLKVVLAGGAGAGLYFVWNPDQLTWIAHRIGIGRGADLVLYGSTLLFFLGFLAVSLRRRETEAQITVLVREISILHARPPRDRRRRGPDDEDLPAER